MNSTIGESVKETIILIHGGMQGGWCWDRVRPILERENLNVLAPSLSGLGDKADLHSPTINLSTHIQDIINIIDNYLLQNVILVGHSYGGIVATGVVSQRPNLIKQLIYLDAVLVEPGQSMATALDPEIWHFILHNIQIFGDGWQLPAMTTEAYGFKNEADQEFVRNRSTPQTLASFAEPLFYDLDLLRKIPVTYIKCRYFHFLSNMEERAKKMGITYKTIDTGHFPMIESPQSFSTYLLDVIKDNH